MINVLKTMAEPFFKRDPATRIQMETDRMELDEITIPVFERVVSELDKLGRQCHAARLQNSAKKR